MDDDWLTVIRVCGSRVADKCDEGEGVKGHAVVRPGRVVVLVDRLYLLVPLYTRHTYVHVRIRQDRNWSWWPIINS